MRTNIWVDTRMTTVKPERPPLSSRVLNSFLFYNDAPCCFMRGRKGWYKITRDNKFLFVERALYKLSLEEWLKIALDDNFTANIPNITYR
jgi:hypothetical protein